MTWPIKFTWWRHKANRWRACVAVIATLSVVTLMSNHNNQPGLLDQKPDEPPSNIVYRRQLIFTPESNFKMEVKQVRSEFGCKKRLNGPGRGPWESPKLALQYATPPAFLPEYKNPCWRANSDETGEPTLYCLPYFHIAGFAKCASTDLFRRVSQHPLILPGLKKEPQYLSRGNWSTCASGHKLVRERTKCFIKEYASKYYSDTAQAIKMNNLTVVSKFCKRDKSCNVVTSGIMTRFKREWQDVIAEESSRFKHPMVTVDSSACYGPDNYQWEQIAENQGCPEPIVGPAHLITRMNPKVYAIFIVRDPTQRIFSGYFHFHSNVTLNSFHHNIIKSVNSFNKCTARKPFSVCLIEAKCALDVGIYHAHIAHWLRLLPRSQILVIENESYKKDMPGTLARIYRFLKLPALSKEALEAISNMDKQNIGEAKSKLTGMFPETEKILREFYAEHNEMLAELLDDDQFAWR